MESEAVTSRAGASHDRPALSIVIVNWNGGDVLRRCLDSIDRFPPLVPFEVIVVDNASSDGSVPHLRAAASDWRRAGACLRLIENSDNAGFSRANNQAIAASEAGLLLLLNADTEVTAGAIDALVETLYADPSAGACGPRLISPDGSLQPSAWRNPPAAWEILVSGTGLWRAIPRRLRGEWLLGRHWDHARRRAVPMLFGAAFLIRRSVIDAVGPLDERFHLYAEDNEWCWRITRAGWRLIFEPAATIVHHGGMFSLQRWGPSEKLRRQWEANFEFQRRCLPRRRMIANLIAGSAAADAQRLWWTITGRPTDEPALVSRMHRAALARAVRGSGARA